MAIVRLEPATEALISLGDFVALSNGNNPSFLASRRIAPCSRPDRPLRAGLWTVVILAIITLLTLGVDFWATIFGAKKFGASKRAVIGALIGLVIGIFLGFPGIIFGPFIGAVVGELSAQKDLKQATRAGVGATIGLVLGAAIKLALALTMIGVFLTVRFLS